MSPHTYVSSDTALDMMGRAYKAFMETDKGKRLFAIP
jgi:hypothetical protein